MKKDFTLLTVGKVFDACKLPDIEGQTGAIFAPVEGIGYMLILFMPNMTRLESELISSGKIQFRVLKETSSFMLALARFGNSDLIYEIGIDPNQYEEKELMKLCIDNNMMAVVGLDSVDNTIKAMRYGNMPNGLRQKFIAAWTNARAQEGFGEKYRRWIADLWGRYDTFRMWDIATYVGRLGE
ncbi:hypothetical protein [Paenibacillus hexagrammi]|uniref:Uncharacterized protein n=1 Tax=Paenibacillus hexagrammi TaxID=2908839 RepID=A0ABY3SR68_9BACL|nr:hypothetical protein [Paenibacillus sp. YPD9-1]UJF36562.1 hypothetical protein L0M14_30710 [Paenibacillus sp. YPD9-1]